MGYHFASGELALLGYCPVINVTVVLLNNFPTDNCEIGFTIFN
jgi:hypothetical protein